MKAFVGINMQMGIKVLPEYKDYWSSDPALNDPFISKTMSRKRYEKLSQYFHCSIAAEEDPQDKLAKVRPLITLCERNFGHLFGPSKNLSVDEAMIHYDGHLSWKQYLPKKPIKWGIKLWCLCDSRTGYCVAFIVYTGAAGNGDVTLDLGYKVVMKLMTKYLLRHHHVYADNYFTSVHLAEDLLQADTYMCGTTRSTRKEFPKTLALAYVPQGQSVKWTREDSSVMVCKWHDKRDICMIATNNAGDDEDVQVRRNRQQVVLSTPTCVRDYNQMMGGVDRLDQYRSYYNVGRSGRRWWKYLFWGIFNIGVINAFILWKLANQPLPRNKRKFALKAFKLKLVHSFMDNFDCGRAIRAPPAVEKLVAAYTVSDDIIQDHPLVRFEGRKRVCQMCAHHKRKTSAGRFVETSFGCLKCKAYLCKVGICFRQFHAE